MKKLLSYNNRSFLTLFFVISFVRTAFILSIPYVSGQFIDSIKLKDWRIFLQFAFLIVMLNLICQVLDYLCDRVAGRLDSHLWRTVTQTTHENLYTYDVSKDDLSSSMIMQQLGQNFDIISPFFYQYPINIVLYGIRAVVILFLLATMSWQLALVVGLLIPIFILFSNHYAERLSSFNKKVVDDMQVHRDYLSDSSYLTKMVRFLGASPLISFKKMGEKYAKSKESQVKMTAFFENFLSYSLLNLMIVLASLISAYQVFTEQMTIGQYFAVQLYVSQFWTPVEYFLNIYQSYISNSSIIESFVDFLNPTLRQYVTNPIDTITLINYISLDRDNLPLHDPINKKLEIGQTYLIKGKNGVGKTRLVEAILGFHNSYQGDIIYEKFGENLNFAYCPAKPMSSQFFDSSVSQGASMGQLKLYQLDKIFNLEKSVYIFDEPTNFLDDKHRKLVKEKLALLGEKSQSIVVVITHDSELWDLADQIIEL